MRTLLKLFALMLLLTACTKQEDEATPVTPTQDAVKFSLNSEQQKRVAQDNDFALDLFKKTDAEAQNDNVFVSPLSVSIALGMAWNGAAGETKTEIETALKMSGLSSETINSYYRIMQKALPSVDPKTKLAIANSIWYKTGFYVKPDFLQINKTYFDAYVKEMDFSQSWAVDTINNWCAAHTNNLIPKILNRISTEDVMYLTNAVYFKGTWAQKFAKEATVESTFTTAANTQVKVNMMSKLDDLSYYQDNNAQYVDIPYGNNSFSMTVILPAEGKTCDDYLNNISISSLNQSLASMSNQKVEVHLPRFKLEKDYSLVATLKAMGMQKAFGDYADFSALSTERIFISEIMHKTYIAVDEEGTEAAAITNIGIVSTSLPNYPVFNANRPFLFMIREKTTGIILFMGKIISPDKY